MPIDNVERLATDLHASGVINLDSKVSDILRIAGIGNIDPGSLVASGAVAWDGYVVVYKGMPAGMDEISRVAQQGGPIG